MNSWCYENNCSRQLFSRKRSIVDVWQGSEYARVLIISEFWIYHDSEYASGTEYTKALNIPGLQRVLNIPVNMYAYT